MAPDEKDNPSQQDSAVGNLVAWLSKEGYPLELRIARGIGEAGWDYILEQRYQDSQSKILRPVDIVARRSRWSSGADISVSISLVIECKSSAKRKPWVVFGGDPEDEANLSADVPFDYDLIPAGELARLASYRVPLYEDGALNVLHVWQRDPGSTVVEAFRDASDNAYGAIMSALGAAVAMADASGCSPFSGVTEPRALLEERACRINFFVPVAVVEAPVYRFWIAADGKEHLEEVGISSVLVDYVRPGEEHEIYNPSRAVHIISHSCWPEFVQRVTRDADTILDSIMGNDDAREWLAEAIARSETGEGPPE